MRYQQGLLNTSDDEQSLRIEDCSESTHNETQNDDTILNKQYNNNKLRTYHVTEDAQEEMLVFSTKIKLRHQQSVSLTQICMLLVLTPMHQGAFHPSFQIL